METCVHSIEEETRKPKKVGWKKHRIGIIAIY